MGCALVIGVGNSFAHDDGAGLATARIVRGMCHPAVRVLELDGEATRIVDAWDGHERVVVIDAAKSGDPPGTIRRLTGEDLVSLGPTVHRSSHGPGVPAAYRLGTALGRLPGSLILYAIEGANFRPGVGLSPAVAWAAGDVATRVHAELQRTPQR